MEATAPGRAPVTIGSPLAVVWQDALAEKRGENDEKETACRRFGGHALRFDGVRLIAG
jgi:hypothetical protein